MNRIVLVIILLMLTEAIAMAQGEVLYNGIRLTSPWPPKDYVLKLEPPKAPYLSNPPAVIPIDVGRQLFVDDFLVDKTTLLRTFHKAEYYASNPILKPDKPWEQDGYYPTAMVFSDGVYYDPADKIFKLWYMAGYCMRTCYATSKDGIHWDKPELNVRKGTNVVHQEMRDSTSIILDLWEKDPSKRYKMFRYHNDTEKPLPDEFLHYSPDGIHWSDVKGPKQVKGDRCTAFYNPFRKLWVYCIRSSIAFGGQPSAVRARRYWECNDPVTGFEWTDETAHPWIGADKLDPKWPGVDTQPQLYNLDCVAYESIVLGLFSIWPCQTKDRPKPNYVALGYSRDGFHWDRPTHEAFLPIDEKLGGWKYGNVQSAGGGCLVVGDKLYFYCSGRAGVAAAVKGESGVCATGLATLRRDGFASMDASKAGGTLTTRPVTFRGKYLFVNADVDDGELLVEVLDKDGRAIEPFTSWQCTPVRTDNTKQAVKWGSATDLSALAGKPVRFRFHLKNGKLYSFWVSPDRSGASHGYVAAGGPGYTGPTDTTGGL